jgi:putative nucleotidyltransferase with HDIG domain
MSTTRDVPDPNVLTAPSAHRPVGPRNAWDVLERLLCDLPECETSADRVQQVLHAVRLATDADVVFWYPGSSRAPLQLLGAPRLAPEWCRTFVWQQTSAAPEAALRLAEAGQLAALGQPGPVPLSAALVRISKSRSIWLVALSFKPARLLDVTDLKVMALARRFFLQERQRVRSQDKLKSTLLGLVSCLTAAINAKNPYTSHHSERVARIAARLGREIGLSSEAQSNLRLAGLLHDVGKIGIDTSVLEQAGPLSAEQRAQIEQHPVIGEQIIAGVPSLAHLRPAIRNHHERFDGTGYPDRLAGAAIPLPARILAVADSCDAMFSARPYRAGMSAERVDAILSGGAGSQWDPEVIRPFMACRRELYAIYQTGLGASVRHAVSDVVRTWEAE